MDTASVVSQKQLQMILQSTRDSVSKSKIIQDLKKVSELSPIEKNFHYHNISQIFKESASTEQMLGYLENFLRERLGSVIESLDETTDVVNVGRPTGKFFHRVG